VSRRGATKASAPQVGTGRSQGPRWSSIDVVPVGTPQEAAAAMGHAMRLLADQFRRWTADRQDTEGRAAHSPTEVR
jgi:hypothetical protein